MSLDGLVGHPAIGDIRSATLGTPYEGALWLVGGAVRDALLGRPASPDFDVVIGYDDRPATGLSAQGLLALLQELGLLDIEPVVYAQFGTGLARLRGANVEVVLARRESYRGESRKPDVEPATLPEDARRRDFTVNALLVGLHSGQVKDPLARGLDDLERRILRTPLEPHDTFSEDPLRMLRAVRFKHQLGFEFAPGLAESIHETRARLAIVSAERIQAELLKLLALPTAADALADLMDLGLFEVIAPELCAMRGVEQGAYHHLDVWDHTLLVVRNAGQDDLVVTLAALLHDVGKPPTRSVDDQGATRFFGHETVGADMARTILQRLVFPNDLTDRVVRLVKNHMRLGSAPKFTDAAARRLLRDLGEDLDRLLRLCEADAAALKPGVRVFDSAGIRETIRRVSVATPRSTLESPLSGEEVMELLALQPGQEVGRAKRWLLEQVLEGRLAPGDKAEASRMLRDEYAES